MSPKLGFETTGDEVVAAFGGSIKGKTVVITGGSAKGLGAGAAIALAAAKPAHIILTARSEGKVTPVIQEINKESPSTKATFVSCELDDFANVRQAASEISSQVDRIDVLINNAGVMAIPYDATPEGIEKTLATNHLGGFLLTGLLMPKILAAAPGARIVNMTSSGHGIGPFRFDDYNFSGGKTYNAWSAYGQSKTANIFHAMELASRYGRYGVLSYAVHPGGIYETSLTGHLDEEALAGAKKAAEENGGTHELDKPKTAAQGISTMLVAALSPEIVQNSGAFMQDCQISQQKPHARSSADAARVWAISEELVKERFPPPA